MTKCCAAIGNEFENGLNYEEALAGTLLQGLAKSTISPDNDMPIAALLISDADLAMMRHVLNEECERRGHDVASVEGKRMARLIMDGFRDGLVTEKDLAALIRRDAEGRHIIPGGRYLKSFPSWR